MIRVVGLGAGGHAKVLVDALGSNPSVEVVGFLDRSPHTPSLMGFPILGTDALLPELMAQGVTHFFVGVGTVRSLQARTRLFELGLAHGLRPLTIQHPQAILSAHAVVGEGVTLLAGAIVQVGAHLAANVVVSTGAVVEHDCRVGPHTHLSPRACLLGDVQVGQGAFIGAGAIIRQGLRIGDGALVAAGAVVTEDVPPESRVRGIPARAF